jgi:hypothetical protein
MTREMVDGKKIVLPISTDMQQQSKAKLHNTVNHDTKGTTLIQQHQRIVARDRHT